MAEEPEWLNLVNEVRVYWLEKEDQAVFHFVDTPGPVVEGWVRDMLEFVKQHREGWTESVILCDTSAFRVERAKNVRFCNHENRPDHANVTVGGLHFAVDPEGVTDLRKVSAKIVIRLPEWDLANARL